MALAEFSEKELSRFITILYFNKEYAEANQQITPVLLKDPDNEVMLRLKGYTAYELGKYPEGLDAMRKFFDLRSSSDTNKIIPSDYEYIGRLYSRTGNDSLAVVYLNKAVEADVLRNGLYEEIARVYEKQKKYLQAIDFYNKFIEARNGDVAPAIFFSIGKDLLLVVKDVTATADSANKTIYLQRADAAFGKVIALSPDSHLGYLWHARVLAALDPETTLGLAKSDYEKALTIIEQKSDLAKYKSDLIEGYRYLGYFYYLQYDAAKEIKDVNAVSQAKTDALKYWQKVLDIEPDNDIARQAIGAIK
jgi:tetratricopeptide (TPR) repeat protein